MTRKFYTPLDLTTDNKIINVKDPVAAQDASTKNYVDVVNTATNARIPIPLEGQLIVGRGSKSNTVDPSGLELLFTGITETIISGCDLALLSVPPLLPIPIVIDLWTSQNNFGTGKQLTVRLRRTNLAGAILQTWIVAGNSDNTSGHLDRVSATISDINPTDGHYVLTGQENNAGNQVWSDTRSFLVGAVVLVGLPIGTEGQALQMTGSLPVWGASASGRPGNDGADGEDGPMGPPGERGPAGVAGSGGGSRRFAFFGG